MTSVRKRFWNANEQRGRDRTKELAGTRLLGRAVCLSNTCGLLLKQERIS